ncbi:MAG: DUF3987 domain-containing protein, partial [Crocosphaera sp.]|uniref:DUF3987 domain-containing protein n=3 Tax=Crocosphaera TaxID=263510 RepID=UPI002590D66E
RVMRLAGGYHISHDEKGKPVYNQTKIITASAKTYTYEELREIIPKKEERLPIVEAAKKQNSCSDPSTLPRHPDRISVPVPAPVPLLQCCRKQVREWVATGVPKGCKRNDVAIEVGLELIAVERYLETIGQSYTDSALSLFHEFCVRSQMTASEEDERYQWCNKTNSDPSCPPDAIEACIKGWYWREVIKPQQRNNQTGSLNSQTASPSVNGSKNTGKNASVTNDATSKNDSSKQVILNLEQTVTTVTELLEKGLPEYEERHYLDRIEGQSEISRAAFWKLVSSLRCGLDEVTQKDRQRATTLIEDNHKTLKMKRLLPLPLANAMNHDGEILNIDPVSLWQYLSPLVLSLVGQKINLDIESHQIPAILWTCIVAESGTGKSRAEKVILGPLKKLQHAEKKRFKTELNEYKELEKIRQKDEPSPPLPKPERKYLFEVATIQAVMKRLSEQGVNGSLWARDEMAGLFKSLNQFKSRGAENEGLECLLKMWDGDGSFVDRVNIDNDSYTIEETRLSITGGIQPGAFRQAFKDPKDPQGLQGRFLYAIPQVKPAKRVKGTCQLNQILPALYQWLDQLPSGTFTLSNEADLLYSQYVEAMGIEAEKSDNAAVRAWLRKLSPQMLRQAMSLHLLHCFFEKERDFWVIEADILKRSIEACAYYRSAFEVVMEKVGQSDSISSLLLKIYDKVLTSSEGLTPRDIYRDISAIRRRAKELGRDVGAYTIELLGQLVNMGKGVLEKKGRFFKFKALLPSQSQPNLQQKVTVVTPPPTLENSGVKLSADQQVSTVTPIPIPIEIPQETDTNSDNLKESTQQKASLLETSSPPTLEELKSLLLTSCTWVQIKNLKKQHSELASEAYTALTPEEQNQVDAVAATEVNQDVFKYVGPQRKIDGVDIEPGTLVYLDPHTKNQNRYFLKVRLLHNPPPNPLLGGGTKGGGWQKVVEISRDALQAIEKAVNDGLDAVEGHQGNLLDGLS